MTLCERCEKQPGEECLDPYVLEINNVEWTVILCPDCYYEICQDI